ncbi:RNA polymerase sigma factor [Salmonirosea aquatica]|uniref:Sigma-70 family RNA polymerase sigma factor n=1 Tax=Salmonirosea aquatica TaxID=2654236 RepID=A0A7C9BDP9_9BACT|nr:sigma-70 family RNA polymerase sigma factor [Cytophagaceae bacterium SJW1-29]
MFPNSDIHNSDLWDAFRRGDRDALDRIYQEQIRSLYGYGFKLVKDKDLVEDCIQDIFVELWEKRERLGPTDCIRFYLFKVLRRTLYRRKSQEQRQPRHLFSLENAWSEESFEFRLILEQTTSRVNRSLQKALDLLSSRQREVIFLRFYDELSFEEIAETMEIDVKSVYKLTYKALDSLKKKISPRNVLISTLLLLSFLYFF